MKKHWLIAVGIVLLAVSATLVWKYRPRTVPVEECSELYRRYSDSSHICASYIKDFRVNDSLTLDVTVLEAIDSAGWDTLTCRYFYVPIFGYDLPDYERKDMETARLAPRVDISLPTDTVFENNVLLILSNEGKALYVFHTETREQMIAIMTMRFKALKIKKNLYL